MFIRQKNLPVCLLCPHGAGQRAIIGRCML